MSNRALPLAGTAILGAVAVLVGFALGMPRPAGAQLRPNLGVPGGNIVAAPYGGPTPPQPIEVQSLDAQHFVVATREPRLVHQINSRENAVQNMLVTVVTYYTVRGDRLVPIEHVRVPTGFRMVEIEE